MSHSEVESTFTQYINIVADGLHIGILFLESQLYQVQAI